MQLHKLQSLNTVYGSCYKAFASFTLTPSHLHDSMEAGMQLIPVRRTALLALATIVAVSCTEQGAAPVAPDQQAAALPTSSLNLEPPTAWLCKVGSTASIEIQINGDAPFVWDIPEDCFAVTFGNGDVQIVRMTEIGTPAGFQLDSIVRDSTTINAEGDRIDHKVTTLTGTNTATIVVSSSSEGRITFFNSPVPPPPPPSGGEGCTPGYWKQSQHFDSWRAPYTPSTQFSAVFENAFPGKTLLQVLAQGGGGLTALGRHTVAALLNGASGSGVSANLTSAQVIAQFNALYPTSVKNGYEPLHLTFAGFNEQGCPLN